MSLKPLLCTVQDLRHLSEYITTEVRDNARLRQCIIAGDAIIRDTLRPLYSIDTGLVESSPWNGPPMPVFAVPDDNINANTGTGELLDVTVSADADKTQEYTITFSSTTAFSVTAGLEGAQGTGATSSEFTTSNGDLTIPTANWLGTPASGDRFLVTVYLAKPLIATISAFLGAGLMLKSTYEGGDASEKGGELWDAGMDLLEKLQKPYEDDGIQLDSFSERDITPEGVQYFIDLMGRDVGRYGDNEQTPWIDSTAGGLGLYGFFYGPVWMS